MVFNIHRHQVWPWSVSSTGQSLLNVPRRKTEFGRHAFSSTAAQIWNQIPLAIRTSPSLDCFKHHLKTHYFTIPWDSNPPSDCPHPRFMFIVLWCVNKFITLHYSTMTPFSVPGMTIVDKQSFKPTMVETRCTKHCCRSYRMTELCISVMK